MLIQELVQKTKSLPDLFLNEVVDMSKTIQKKMRKYTDTVNGRNNVDFMLSKPHMEFLNNLRLSDPEKYKTLVYFAYIYQTLDIDDQAKAVKTFLPSIGL